MNIAANTYMSLFWCYNSGLDSAALKNVQSERCTNNVMASNTVTEKKKNNRNAFALHNPIFGVSIKHK